MGFFSRKPKPTFQATIQSLGKSIQIKHRQTLLEAALDAGLDFPFSCGAGSCTTCKCKLIQGEYKDLSDMSLVLSPSDLKKGYILACQTIPKTDLIVTLEADDSKEYLGEIVQSTLLTHDIIELKIRLNEKIKYVAGQYADITVPTIKGSRSYSFASAPGAGGSNFEVIFHLRLVPKGEMTTWAHEASRVGEKVRLIGPRGSFGLRTHKKNLLFIAGGSGMAPVKAILEDIAQKKLDHRIIYLFGARTQKDLYCLEEMKRLEKSMEGRFVFFPVLSNEDTGSTWQGERGLVADYIEKIDFAYDDATAYLCGPPPMIDAAIPKLNAKGISADDIFFDKFTDKSHVKH